ncbi:MAG: imidazoleglycerol-phosphate dehydratase, partial [Actinomycetales bacterium]|nr:imidazoleglycerol-phosphate dehydratase [Candidatus Phosphoribacter baldrii]
MSDQPARRATVRRATSESSVALTVDLDGTGRSAVSTGVGFYDHMLASLAKHALLDLDITATGDVESTPTTPSRMGDLPRRRAARSVGDKHGISRFGDATVPLDEALVQAVVDVAGRPLLRAHRRAPRAGSSSSSAAVMSGSLTRHVFETLAHHAGIALHVRVWPDATPTIVEAQ